MIKKDVPDRWEQDSISKFIEDANRNTYGVFVHYRDWFSCLSKIDATYEWFTENSINLPKFWEALLFVRSHSSYRGAVRLSTSGQLPEAYSLLRGCLENALYAFYFYKYPGSIQIWLSRDDNEIGKKKARKELTFGRMLAELEESNATIGQIARTLYERTIDAGAHPNRKSITLALSREDTEDSVFFNIAQLNITHEPLLLCLKTNAQIGLCSLQIFGLIFKEKFDLLGLSEEILRLARTKINGLHL